MLAEDKDRIINEVRPIVVEKKLVETNDVI